MKKKFDELKDTKDLDDPEYQAVRNEYSKRLRENPLPVRPKSVPVPAEPVQQDPRSMLSLDLLAEINKLQALQNLSPSQSARLQALQAELQRPPEETSEEQCLRSSSFTSRTV